MNLKEVHNVFFIGIGGIGMSALARYLHLLGKNVAGYDRSETPLTKNLEREGIHIIHQDDPVILDTPFQKDSVSLVVYTPAIAKDHCILNYFIQAEVKLMKRAMLLGLVSSERKTVAVAGTHGKTTTSTYTSFLYRHSKVGCSAFLGGISKDFDSNLLYDSSSQYVVLEADEYDRSFLTLEPTLALITSVDADHLDIYGDYGSVVSSFNEFVLKIKNEGKLVVHRSVKGQIKVPKYLKCFTYSLDDSTADFRAENIKKLSVNYQFDLHTPYGDIKGLKTGIPGLLNLENAIGAIALAMLGGVEAQEILTNLEAFSGVSRRFDIQYKSKNMIYIDDYAHHPEEISKTLKSVRSLFPDRKITGVFQPHLYSRTKDFYEEFGVSLTLLDELVLLPIYPAREKPMEGVTSQLILDQVSLNQKQILTMGELIAWVDNSELDILITMGAGDIDTMVKPITKKLEEKVGAQI